MATILWQAPGTADAPTWTTLAALAIGGYALSSIIDNTSLLVQNAVLDFGLPSAVTCGASAPFIGITVLYALDGTTYPTPPGATAGATGIVQSAVVPAVASASFTRGQSTRFEVLPFKFKLLAYNGLGVAFPSGTFVTNLYRFGETVT